ncbi:PepSY domain-containing protein [Salinisphaera aquimarina]|uniref:PepSY domain-containing protein n=1 Tax=Salinisphaera aquimarina TaxID=2094031 RepID=A0ABV7ER07_9GAMM
MAALCLLLLVTATALPSTAVAQTGSALRAPFAESAGPGKDRGHKKAAKNEDRRLPPNVAPGEAAQRASREYGGRVLNVVLEDGPGGPYYRVKLLDGGRVRVVHVEARR